MDNKLNSDARYVTMPTEPDHLALLDLAATQSGLFSRAQAAAHGFSDAVLSRQVQAGRFSRVRRGIYRIRGATFDPNEALIALWLATDGAAIFVDETALVLHGLSEVLPTRVHLALPPPRRRLQLGSDVAVQWREIPPLERGWAAGLPVTTVFRTLLECANAGLASDQLGQATAQARNRGLLGLDEVAVLADAIERGAR